MKAVIDRIIDGKAVVLFDEDEIEVIMPVQLLPDDIKEGTWLQVNFLIDHQLTESRLQRNLDLLEKIKARNKNKNKK